MLARAVGVLRSSVRDKMPREINRKLGTGADAASHLDLAADRLDEMLHNRESQAGAAKFAAARFVYAIEPFKNTRQVVARDSDPGVGNFDPGGVVAGGTIDAHRPAFGCVLDRVVDQVVDDLADGFLIREDQRFGLDVADLERQVQVLGFRAASVRLNTRFQNRDQVKRTVVEDFMAGL